MPFPASMLAVRQHYDPAWHNVDEDGEPIKSWRVRFDWSLSGKFDQVIEADTEADAIEIAKDWVHDDTYSACLEISSKKVEAQ